MTPRHPTDDDSDPYLVAALESYAATGVKALPEVYTALLDAEVFVPVVARLLERDEETGGDKRSQMELLTLKAGDREALLVFSGWQQMQAWRADVRPVPVSARDACAIAIEREFDALVIDVAGPTTFVLEEDAMSSIADGFQPVTGALGVSAKSTVDVDIRRVASLPEFAAEAVRQLGLDVIPLEIEEGDGQWRPAIGIVADLNHPIGEIASQLAGRLAQAIDMVPLTPTKPPASKSLGIRAVRRAPGSLWETRSGLSQPRSAKRGSASLESPPGSIAQGQDPGSGRILTDPHVMPAGVRVRNASWWSQRGVRASRVELHRTSAGGSPSASSRVSMTVSGFPRSDLSAPRVSS